jgi:hypothetical protein
MPHEVFFEIGVAEALRRRPDIAEETIRAAGSTIGAVIHIAAAMAEEVEYDGVMADDAGYLDTARGDALTRYVASEYGEARHGATAARVELRLTRTGTAEVTLPSGFAWSSGEGVVFATDVDVYWPASDTSPKTVPATATEVGPQTNLPANRTWTAIGALPDASIAAANLAPAAGGNAEEPDDALVARVRDLQSRRIRGTLGAIVLGAQDVPQVRKATAFEALDAQGKPSGGVVLAVADDAGRANAALAEAVRAAEDEWRPAGCFLQTLESTPVEVAISVQTVWAPGYGALADKATVQATVAARVNRLLPRSSPANAPANPESVLTHDVIKEVRPLVPGLLRLSVLTPAGTVEPAQGQVIRTRPGLVVVS